MSILFHCRMKTVTGYTLLALTLFESDPHFTSHTIVGEGSQKVKNPLTHAKFPINLANVLRNKYRN